MSEQKLNENQLFKHVDGGIYLYEKTVQFADDSSDLVVYRHLFPFEEKSYARRKLEFVKKFMPIEYSEYEKLQELDAHDYQQVVAQNKKLRKQKEQNN